MVVNVNQSAFVKGRQILDGILIANDTVDEAKKKKELILFKVDFEKTYDLVEWSYLFSIMSKMIFPCKWRKWISKCVRSTSASVLVNGSPEDEFKFERGLRQGDPLSPFLFLIVAEGLNAMVNASVHAKVFSGFSVREDESFKVTNLIAYWGNPRRLSFWKPVTDRITSRLLAWNFHYLSLGSFGSSLSCIVFTSGLFSFLLQGSQRGFHLLFWDDHRLEEGVSLRDDFLD
ncbi:cysteine-rich receptor-like protein kinase [Trifolium pratense]|uniref:Cysteine-rich receptor-like protein kinase n=1 Tax=Trifolium pratense TaxID=57577 RepID=A0A2K3PIW7_TRIPR|nr:cysteine-rich receptor-like protein kinase [Trifolium pratense]